MIKAFLTHPFWEWIAFVLVIIAVAKFFHPDIDYPSFGSSTGAS